MSIDSFKKKQLLIIAGANIKKIRQSKKIEIKVVAKALSISPQAYGCLENGKTDLNISRLIELSEFYGVPYTKFLDSAFNHTSHTINNFAPNLLSELEKVHEQLATILQIVERF